MNYNILIVDDDILFLQAICKDTDFCGLGFSDIYTATNLRDAREIIKHKSVSLLLCDIELPGENGLDLIQTIQSRNLPIITILLTCYSSFDYAQRAIRLSVADYLLKPIRNEVLSTRLRQVYDTLVARDVESEHHVIDRRHDIPVNLSNDDLVKKVQEYIDENISEELTREQIGKAFFMNADYIARVFKSKMGICLNQYIRNRRIECAKKLLIETGLPINIICSMVGYNYNTYFFNQFKLVTGVSPTEFRRKDNI